MANSIEIDNIAFNVKTKFVGGLKIVKRTSFPNTTINDIKNKLEASSLENNYFETEYSKNKWKNATNIDSRI